jgi:hypothetical protein
MLDCGDIMSTASNIAWELNINMEEISLYTSILTLSAVRSTQKSETIEFHTENLYTSFSPDNHSLFLSKPA